MKFDRRGKNEVISMAEINETKTRRLWGWDEDTFQERCQLIVKWFITSE
jgi:hypothetical protein